MNAKTLILDTSFQPIGEISWQKAMTLYFSEKVQIIEEYADLWVRSANQKWKVPSIVRFIKGVFNKMKRIKFSRENIYLRDKGICQYCLIPVIRQEFTLDHVKPRCYGGLTTWENVVVCCIDCNRVKANLTPEQAGMKLKKIPVKPKNLFKIFSWKNTMPNNWREYISSMYWHGELENDE